MRYFMMEILIIYFRVRMEKIRQTLQRIQFFSHTNPKTLNIQDVQNRQSMASMAKCPELTLVEINIV